MFPCINFKPVLLVLATGLLLAGCAYHGRVPRGIYHPLSQPQRADVSLLVISDKNIPPEIVITDPTSAALYDFTLTIGDGTAVAVTDALSALVTRADAGPQRLEKTYDFVVDVQVEAGLTRADCTGSMTQLAARQDGLCTQVMFSLRRGGEQTVLGSFSGKRWGVFAKRGAASTVRWVNKSSLYILSAVLIPLYTQLQGEQLRQQYQTHIKEILDDIVAQLESQPQLFQTKDTPTH